jgi:hypothetical protein
LAVVGGSRGKTFPDSNPSTKTTTTSGSSPRITPSTISGTVRQRHPWEKLFVHPKLMRLLTTDDTEFEPYS